MSEPLTLYCVKCNAAYSMAGEIPQVCGHCLRLTSWTTHQPATSPLTAFHNSETDKAFLKDNGFSQDD